jgi:hypothetical protein
MRGLFLGAMLAVGVAILAAGCGGSSGSGKPSGKDVAKEESGHGWWCDEHGVKEEECSMCTPAVARKFKDKGDWCELHNRAKSQCFICDPSLREKFAADYRAKYGKEPPEPTGNMPEKK